MSNGFENVIFFSGVVEDRKDPKKLGRLRVRAFGFHSDSKEEVPNDTLPWAIPVIGTYDHSYKVPLEGEWVFGLFLDGNDAQHPMILGVIPGMPTTFVNQKEGFNSNTDVNPPPGDIYQPDIPRQARGEDLAETIAAQQHALRSKDCESGLIQPTPPYKSQYPYNKVHQTESGHAFELDDTPGSERINMWHRTGTFMEMDPAGGQTNKIQGKNVKIVEQNDVVWIRGNAKVLIEGTNDVEIRGHCNLTIDGDLNTNVHGDYFLNVAGGIYMNSGDIFAQKSSAIRQEAYMDSYNLYAKQNIQVMTEKGNITLHSNTGYIGAYAKTDLRFESSGNTYIKSIGSTDIVTNTDLALQSGQRMDLRAVGVFAAQSTGSNLDLKSSGDLEIESTSNIHIKSDTTHVTSTGGSTQFNPATITGATGTIANGAGSAQSGEVDPDKASLGRPSGARVPFRPLAGLNPIDRKFTSDVIVEEEEYPSILDPEDSAIHEEEV